MKHMQRIFEGIVSSGGDLPPSLAGRFLKFRFTPEEDARYIDLLCARQQGTLTRGEKSELGMCQGLRALVEAAKSQARRSMATAPVPIDVPRADK